PRHHLRDVAALRREYTEQRLLLRSGTVELAERQYQVLDEGIELSGGDGHTVVRPSHVPTGVAAGPARCFADLIDEHLLESRDVSPLEFAVDPDVVCAAG